MSSDGPLAPDPYPQIAFPGWKCDWTQGACSAARRWRSMVEFEINVSEGCRWLKIVLDDDDVRTEPRALPDEW